MSDLGAHSSGSLLGINKRGNSKEWVLRRVMNGARGHKADCTLTSSSNYTEVCGDQMGSNGHFISKATQPSMCTLAKCRLPSTLNLYLAI